MTDFDVEKVEAAVEELDGAAAFAAADGDGRVTSQTRFAAGEDFGGVHELIAGLVLQTAGEAGVPPSVVLGVVTRMVAANEDAPRVSRREETD